MIKSCYSIHFSSKSISTVCSQFSNPFSVPFLPFSSHLIQYYHHFFQTFYTSSFVPHLNFPLTFPIQFLLPLIFPFDIFLISFMLSITYPIPFLFCHCPCLPPHNLSPSPYQSFFFVPSHCPHCLSPFHAHVIIL